MRPFRLASLSIPLPHGIDGVSAQSHVGSGHFGTVFKSRRVGASAIVLGVAARSLHVALANGRKDIGKLLKQDQHLLKVY